jgi:hypothetical protein
MIEEYLNVEFNKTKWPFFKLTDIVLKFGKESKSELTKLKEQGKIIPRRGLNGSLVQLLITNDGEIIN